MLSFVVAASLSCVPGLFRLWVGRRFRNARQDPALAERWWTSRIRAGQVSFATAVVLALALPDRIVVTIPAMLLGSAIGGYPARRAVFNEAWSLPAYLWWVARLVLGVWGFWIALAFLPWVLPARVATAGSLAAAGVLVFWQLQYGSLLLASLGARRLDPAELSDEHAEGFGRVLERSTAPRPGLWRAGPVESTLANAVALPSTRRPSVLFSNALLAALSAREAVAILAHEMGHLEHFDRRRLAAWSTVTLLLIGCATLVIPRLPAGDTRLLVVLWPGALFAAFAARARWQQANETASDRRAVELCGDPEALASGLIKLHALGRVPRRWSAAFEQRASHPSLARRLAAIRTRDAAVPIGTTVIEGSDHSTWVVVEPDRIRHLRGVPPGTAPEPDALVAAAAQAVAAPYTDLRELRVAAGAGGHASLRITLARGSTLSCPVQASDLPRLQAALDLVDHLIVPADPRDHRQRLLLRGLGVSLTLAGVLLESPVLMALGILPIASPTPGSALGVGLSTAAAAIAAFAAAPWMQVRGRLEPAMLGALAAVLLWTAWRWTPDEPPRRRWMLPGALAGATWLLWALMASLADNLLVLHRLAATSGAAVLAPLALGGVLWRHVPERRVLAVGSWLLALLPLAAGWTGFARYVVRDPLMPPAPTARSRAATLEPLAHGPAPDYALRLTISPDGRHFTAGADEDDEGDPSGEYVVGTVGAAPSTLAATDVAILDDDHLLVLRRGDGTASLALTPIDDARMPLWERPVDASDSSRLYVEPGAKRWRLIGYQRDRVTRVEGDGAGNARMHSWNVSARDAARTWMVGDDDAAIGVRVRWTDRWWRPYALTYFWTRHVPSASSLLYVADGRGVRLLASTDQQVDCGQPAPGRPVLCLARDGGVTRVFRFSQGRLEPIGQFDGDMYSGAALPTGELTAWYRADPMLIEPTGEILALRDPAGSRRGYWSEWTGAGNVVGALVQTDDGTEVRTFVRR